MILFSYWRSTTSYRVRVALSLLGLDHQIRPVDLLAGEQRAPDYAALNPGKCVPTLVLDDGTALTQSMAILEYLHETHAHSTLLPDDPLARARVRAAAQTIAMDIHPVNNLRIIGELKKRGATQDDTVIWMNRWMRDGFQAFQSLVNQTSPFSFGQGPDMADICLTAQMYNARRWGLDLTPFDRLVEIETTCLALDAFKNARPENQPDAI